MREYHVRICERLRAKLPGSTRQAYRGAGCKGTGLVGGLPGSPFGQLAGDTARSGEATVTGRSQYVVPPAAPDCGPSVGGHRILFCDVAFLQPKCARNQSRLKFENLRLSGTLPKGDKWLQFA